MSDDLIKFLEEKGFVEVQGINYPSGPIVRLANNQFACSRYSTRRKFCKEEWRVTVGKRTTCMYLVLKGKVEEMYNFKTKNLKHIESTIKSLLEGGDEKNK